MRSTSIIPALAGLAAATITITDPSDFVGTVAWEADNAVPADYSPPPTSYHTLPYYATESYTGVDVSLDHEVFTQTANDSSVLIFTEGTTASLQYVRAVKSGYSSNLIEASFFGINAAVWVGNDSTATLDNMNITVHNGAANVYTYGTDSVTTITNSKLYSSGPVSHGLYASGNGTIYGQYLSQYSGGYRSSAFSGDSPAGYIHVQDSVAHTDGIGSAICYALGLCNITNVIGHASQSPAMFMDGIQEAIWTGCDLTAGLLAGMIMFSSGARSTGATLLLENTKLTVLGDTMPGLFFGNTVASATIISSVLNVSASGIFAVANYSQVTQDFDYFADYSNAPWLSPAEVKIVVQESAIDGDMVAYNGSSIDLCLESYTSWLGKGYSGYGLSTLAVYLDSTSNWTLTGDTTLENFTDADTTFSNVIGNGFNIWYNETAPANAYLNKKKYSLTGGGQLKPAGTGNLAAHGYWGGYGSTHQKKPSSTYAYPAPTWVY